MLLGLGRRRRGRGKIKNINNKMAITTSLSTITFVVNTLNASIKRYRVAEWTRKQDSYAACKRLTSDQKTYTDWKLRDGERCFMKLETENKKSLGSNTYTRQIRL